MEKRLRRDEKILLNIDKNGRGIEIGASYDPIAPKKKGFNVETIDHLETSALKEKYKTEGVNIENIEQVDYVWQGESFTQLTGKENYYDWIVASHVVEHTPDLVAFLNDCSKLLKDDGILSLAVPDVRFCFDYFRPITGISKIIDAHVLKNKVHTPGTAIEFLLNFTTNDGKLIWNKNTSTRDFAFKYSLEDALKALNDNSESEEYSDYHNWCFTPNSFRLIINDLNDLGLIQLKEHSFMPTSGCEFFITLSRNGGGSNCSRLDLLEAMKLDVSETYGFFGKTFRKLRL